MHVCVGVCDRERERVHTFSVCVFVSVCVHEKHVFELNTCMKCKELFKSFHHVTHVRFVLKEDHI